MKCICQNDLTIRKPYSTNFNIDECESCGSQFFSKTGDVQIRFNYNSENEKYDDENYLTSGEFRWAHFEIEKILKNKAEKNLKILEIGCFNGFYVNYLFKKYAIDVYGTDVNKKAINIGKTVYPEIQNRLSYAEPNKASKYDIIILIDVFEHVDNPKEFIGDLYELLKENGKILLSGPTKERVFYDKTDRPPHHTWRYSSNGMIEFFAQNKFKIIGLEIERNGYLALRNFIGNILSGNPKEYYGENISKKLNRKDQTFRILSLPFVLPINLILRIFNLQYCSRLMIYEKI